MTHFADRLLERMRARGNAVCVGLDPRWESLPHALQPRLFDRAQAPVKLRFLPHGKQGGQLHVVDVGVIVSRSGFEQQHFRIRICG